MNKFKLIILFIFLIGRNINAQKIFRVDNQFEADIKVYVVDFEFQADLKVYKVKYENEAGENNGKWFFARYCYQPVFKVYFVENITQSELKIFFVDFENHAGWRDSTKMYLLDKSN